MVILVNTCIFFLLFIYTIYVRSKTMLSVNLIIIDQYFYKVLTDYGEFDECPIFYWGVFEVYACLLRSNAITVFGNFLIIDSLYQ